MANKPIQSIKYPGLSDTYTFTQVDPTFTEPGQAPDAKETGDRFDQNEANITDLLSNEYKAYATDTATGTVASFEDGADNIPMKDVTVQIEPVQDLHGYDNPWPAGGGKNLFNYDAWKTVNITGGTGVFENNGIKITATNNDAYTNYTANEFPATARIPVSEGDVITLAWEESTNTAGSVYIFPNGASTGAVSTSNVNHKSLSYTVGAGITFITFRFGVSTSGNTISYKNIQVVKGTTVPAWIPYSNICPISGWTGVNVSRTGKNLIDINEFEPGIINTKNGIVDHQGVSISSKGDGTIVWSSTLTWRGITTELIRVSAGNTYFISLAEVPSYIICGFYDAGRGYINRVNASSGVIQVPNGASFIRITLQESTAGNYTYHTPQLELGSAATDYEPYGQTYPITFPTEADTVYGGTLDVTTGELVVDSVMWTKNTALMSDDEDFPGWRNAGIRTIVGANINQDIDTISNVGNKIGINTNSSNDVIYMPKLYYKNKTLAEWRALALDVQCVVTLATPITYQLTPTEVRSLLGQNNVWADAGDTTAEYRADTKLYISKKITEAVSALS